MRTLWSRGAAFTVWRPHRWAPLLLACALSAAPVRAQTRDASSPTHSATLWLTDDGLPAGDVLAMAQDRDGYLWLGMNTGLVRFDGHQFLPWGARGESPLPGNRIDVVLASRDGSLWLGYGDHDGVTRVHDGRVATYAGGRDGLVGGSVSALLEDRAGLLWLGSSEGLSAFRAGGWEDLGRTLGVPRTEVFSLYEDRRGTIWVGTAAGVYRRARDHEAFSLVDATSNFVQSFVEDDAGTIWVTDSQRIMRPLAGALPRYADRVRLPTAGWRLVRAHDGTVWIAALGGGLLRVDPTRSDRVALIERAGHEDKIVGSPRSLFQDRHNNIWMGMRGGGLVRLAETIFKTDIPLEGLTNDGVRGLAASASGEVWVGTGHDLNRVTERGRQVFNLAQTLALHIDRSGALWASTAGGVGRFANGRLDLLPLAPGIRIERVISITTDPAGDLWLCSIDQGLLRSTGGIVAPYTGDPAIAGKACNFIYADLSGRLWIAFSRIGVAVYEAGRFDIHAEANGTPLGSVVAITQDATGAMWIGTSSSLSRLQNGVFTTVGPRNGLPDKLVPSMIDDEQGALWVGVSSGAEIVRFNRSEVDAVAANPSHQIKYARYGVSDGLQGELHFLTRPGVVRGHDGKLWFVTGRGVAVIDPRRPGGVRESTPLRIERVAVGGHAWPLDRETDTLPNGSSLDIDYAAPSLSSGAKMRFRQLLEGFETEWVDVGTRRTASYASLPSGTYRFRVAATGVDTVADSEAVWSFVIAPPFYQRAWFYAASTAFVALAFWGYWQLRLHAVRRHFAVVVAERTRVSREIHDTLLQSLGAVGLELEVVARQLDGSGQTSSEALRRLRGRVRNCISEARESIWELRSPAPLNRTLPDALRELAEDASSLGAVEVTVTVNGRPRDFGHDIAHHLLRIAQEATNNAIRHGHAQHVMIELDYHGHSLTLRIRDDGCGFSETHVTDTTRDRWGLVNIRERAERVGGTLRLDSAPGKGTVVEVAVPLG